MLSFILYNYMLGCTVGSTCTDILLEWATVKSWVDLSWMFASFDWGVIPTRKGLYIKFLLIPHVKLLVCLLLYFQNQLDGTASWVNTESIKRSHISLFIRWVFLYFLQYAQISHKSPRQQPKKLKGTSASLNKSNNLKCSITVTMWWYYAYT